MGLLLFEFGQLEDGVKALVDGRNSASDTNAAHPIERRSYFWQKCRQSSTAWRFMRCGGRSEAFEDEEVGSDE